MKKLLTLIAFALMALTGNAQLIINGDVDYDGELSITDVMILVDIILGKTPQSYLSCPDNNHPHMVDLGLPSGTKWACCNVGADNPEAYGGYYAWGETEEKEVYDWNTYIHCDGSSNTCHDLGSDIAGTQYDVAHVKWGGSWVMPNLDQIQELLDNCSSEWTILNGVNGRRFTSVYGGTIFLPAAGYRTNGNLINPGSNSGCWSSIQYPSNLGYASELGFHSDDAHLRENYDRYIGLSVRPVSK